MSAKRCIYCHKDSSSSSQIPHAFPESLLLDGPAFAVGEMCDKCNQYFGKELETMLTMHPLIAMHIQSYGLLGKKRKARKRLNVFERVQEEGETVLRFATASPIFQYNAHGIRVGARISPLWDSNFHMGRFSRGLHMIAFNLAVLNRGVDMAFEPRYTPVREYIRKPRSSEFWPFVQVVQDLSEVKLHPYVAPIEPIDAHENSFGELVGINIFNLHFIVDLLNIGILKEGRIRVSEPAGEVAVIGPDWAPPRQEPQIVGDKEVHYRVTIK